MLAQLKFSNVTRSAGSHDSTARVRAKVAAAIAEQKASVEAAIKREPFVATRRVGGETRERRFRPWYFKAGGLWFTSIHYGTSPLQLPGGHSIEAGPQLGDLLATFDHTISAVNAGELDAVLLAAAAKRSRKEKHGKTAQQAPAAAPRSPSPAPEKPAKAAGVSGSAKARNKG